MFVRVFFLAMMILPNVCLGSVMIDRILMKINESAFTQRELENYLLVKAVRKSQRQLIASEKNWYSAVRAFKDDMLIYEESRKLRYPVEASATLPADVQYVKAAIQKDAELRILADRLLLTEKDIETILRVMLRVDKYKGEQRENAFDTMGVPPKRRVPFLDKRNSVRMYDDAMSYRHIEPNAFKFNK